MPAVDFALPPGTIVAKRYKVLKVLGAGSMATVYHARDRETEALVALKVLHKRHAGNQDVVRRFHRETIAARRVQHPSVVRYLDYGVVKGTHFATMEVVAGETLAEFIDDNGPQPQLACRLAMPLTRALAAIHAAGIIHRDVKPTNLLMSRNHLGELDGLKVMDMGLVRIMRSPITQTGHVMGTVNYMAPEQVLGEVVDSRVDIYAVGVVMFYICCGELPFTGRDSAECLAHHLLSKAPPPSWLNDQLSPAIDALIGKALRKNPDNRYLSAIELSHAIADIEEGRGDDVVAGAAFSGVDEYVPRTDLGRDVYNTLKRVQAR